MAAKEDLHALIDALPEDRVETARRLLQQLRSGDGEVDLLSAEELAEIDQAREAVKAGEWFSLEQIKRENGLY
jgi:hypothetical protein